MNVNVTFDDMSERNSDIKFGDFSGIDKRLLEKKVDKQQGEENAGKVLGIGENGFVFPTDMPKKLTDLENDLYYAKEKLVCEITKNDFVVNKNIGLAGYEIEPMVEGLTPDNFTIKIHAVVGEETHSIQLGHSDFNIEQLEDGKSFFAAGINFHVFVVNGVEFTEEGEELKNATFIYILPDLLNNADEVTVNLFLTDANKVPKEIIPIDELPVVRTDVWQDLTDAQKEIARENIDAASIEIENVISNAVYNGNQQSIPIVTTAGTGSEYTVTIPTLSGRPPTGFLFVAIPHTQSNSFNPKIKINGLYTYEIVRLGERTSHSGGLDGASDIVASTPILLFIKNRSDAQIINITGLSYKRSSVYSSCTTSATVQNKVCSYVSTEFDGKIGSALYVKFSYTNTASNPKLAIYSGYPFAILDRSGNAIAADRLQAGIIYQFMFTGSEWVLVD